MDSSSESEVEQHSKEAQRFIVVEAKDKIPLSALSPFKKYADFLLKNENFSH